MINSSFDNGPADCSFIFPCETAAYIKKMLVHRRVLAALSPVFAAKFNVDWSDGSSGVLITDTTFDSFELLMRHFYQGTVALNANNVVKVWRLAQTYWVEDLLSSCMAFITGHLSVDNVIAYFELAIFYGQDTLRLKCIDMIAARTEAVLRSPAFLGCTANTLNHVLRIRKMSYAEHHLFDACIAWAANRCRMKSVDAACPERLRDELGDSLWLIRFNEMNRLELRKRFMEHRAMFTKDDVAAILLDCLQEEAATFDMRYVDIDQLLAGAEDVDRSISFDFGGGDAATSALATKVPFRLSGSLVLTGISFAQPFLKGANVHLGYNFSLSINRRATTILMQSGHMAPSDADYAPVVLRGPVFIEAGQVYELQLALSVEKPQPQLDPEVRLSVVKRREKNAITFIPVRGQADASIDSFISALHFERCKKTNIQPVVGAHLFR